MRFTQSHVKTDVPLTLGEDKGTYNVLHGWLEKELDLMAVPTNEDLVHRSEEVEGAAFPERVEPALVYGTGYSRGGRGLYFKKAPHSEREYDQKLKRRGGSSQVVKFSSYPRENPID